MVIMKQCSCDLINNAIFNCTDAYGTDPVGCIPPN
jgi:hypothetical protein